MHKLDVNKTVDLKENGKKSARGLAHSKTLREAILDFREAFWRAQALLRFFFHFLLNLRFCLYLNKVTSLIYLFALITGLFVNNVCCASSNLQLNENRIEATDKELIDCALEKLKIIASPEKHFVVAAIRTQSGKIYTGINLKTTATRASVCAESVALAKCIEASEESIDSLVIVAYLTPIDGTQEPVFVTPCGICRELLLDYAPQIKIIYNDQGIFYKVLIRDLLPLPYKR